MQSGHGADQVPDKSTTDPAPLAALVAQLEQQQLRTPAAAALLGCAKLLRDMRAAYQSDDWAALAALVDAFLLRRTPQ